MNVDQKRRWVAEYFSDSIEKYTVPCIERLKSEFRPDSQGLRGCAIALALTSFSILDFFGYLLRPDPQPKPHETRCNLKYIFHGADGFFDPQLAPAEAKFLIKFCRHGIVHQYFPKSAGIAKAGELPLMFKTGHGETRTTILNVDALADSCLKFLTNAKVRLLSESGQIMLNRFVDRAIKVLLADREALRECMNKQPDLIHVETMHYTEPPDPEPITEEPRLPDSA